MNILNRIMIDGEFQIVDEYIDSNNDVKKSDDFILFSARYATFTNNYIKAKALYKKIELLKDSGKYTNQAITDEIDKASKILSINENSIKGENAVYKYLQRKQADISTYENISYTDIEDRDYEKAYEELIEDILEETKRDSDEDENDRIDELVDFLKDSNTQLQRYYDYGTFEQKSVERILDDLDDLIYENPDYVPDQLIVDDKAMLLVLTEDYDELVEWVYKNGNYNNFALLSELYLNKHITDEDFEKVFDEDIKDIYDDVIDLCKDITDEIGEDDQDLIEYSESVINRLKVEMRNIVLCDLKNKLDNFEDEIPAADLSQIYYQKAKIDGEINNTLSESMNFTNAVETVFQSRDYGYKEPFVEIIDVIENNNGDLQELAELAKEVESNSINIDDTLLEKIQTKTDEYPVGEYEEIAVEQKLINHVSKMNSLINIGNIDVTEFPVVKAEIQMGYEGYYTIQELKDVLEVSDCYIGIDKFEIQKQEIEGSKIILLCDVSGSMEPNVYNLKDTITNYIGTMQNDELVSVVGFDDQIVFETDFSNEKDILYDAVDNIGAYGGTSIASSINYSLMKFYEENNYAKTIIVLTDGQDSELVDFENLSEACKQLGVNIFTIGLGAEVVQTYLEDIATAGSGQFLYVNDAQSLNLFYSFLHNQLDNRYTIEFTAKDVQTPIRNLTVGLSEMQAEDSKNYYIDDAGQYQSYIDSNLIDCADVPIIYGLSEKFISTSSHGIKNSVIGENFNEDDILSIKLEGDKTYKINKYEFIDSTDISFTIPANIEGTFDLIITINGTTFTLENELSIFSSTDRKTIQFGDYEFNSSNAYFEDDLLVLEGMVVLNDFINFNGSLEIMGFNQDTDTKLFNGQYKDTMSRAIQVYDDSGMFIEFNSNTAKGLAKEMAEINCPIQFPELGSFELYNDSGNEFDSEDYLVDEIDLSVYTDSLFLKIFYSNDMHISIYPNRIGIEFGYIDLDFPFQKQLMKTNLPLCFTFEANADGIITKNEIALLSDISYKQDSDILENLKKFNIGSVGFYIKEAGISIDTLQNNYEMQLMVCTKFISEDVDFGFELGIKEMQLNKVLLKVDKDVDIYTTIPMTLSDFLVGADNITSGTNNVQSKESSDKQISELNKKLIAGCDLEVGALSSIKGLGLLDKMTGGELCIIEFSDIRFVFEFPNFCFDFESNVELFGEVNIGNVAVKLGNYTYSNFLLGIDRQDVTGIYLNCEANPKIKIGDAIDVGVSGSLSASLATNGVILEERGDIHAKIDWGRHQIDEGLEGVALIGIYSYEGRTKATYILRARSLVDNRTVGIVIELEKWKLKTEVTLR